jgi:HK97 family phage prohead protease
MDEGLSSTGRRMLGYALRWQQPAFIAEGGRQHTERFARGAFLTSISKSQVRLVLEHDWHAIVATQSDGSLVLVEDSVGLRVDAWANDTEAADSALEAVRTRWNAGLSVSFSDAIATWRHTEMGRQRIVTSCTLLEISVCRNPAYRSSEVVAGAMRIDAFLSAIAQL